MEVEEIKRGEIYMVNIEGIVGSNSHIQSSARPMLIIQNDVGNRFSPTTIGALITSREKKEYPMHQDIYLDRESTIMYEQILTIDKDRLVRKMGELNDKQMLEAEKKLAYSLGMVTPTLTDIKSIEVLKSIIEESKYGKEEYYVVSVSFEEAPRKEVRVSKKDFGILTTFEEVEEYLTSLEGLKTLEKILKKYWQELVKVVILRYSSWYTYSK